MQASIKTKSTTIFINNTCISCFFVTPIIVYFFAIFFKAWVPPTASGLECPSIPMETHTDVQMFTASSALSSV